VILTRFEISRRGGPGTDATPDDYRHHSLRTAGRISGSGQRLDSFSIAKGLLVNSTQTTTQDSDYDIISTTTHNKIHHVGSVQSQSEIALVPQAASAP
jgi:hypothetical protein